MIFVHLSYCGNQVAIDTGSRCQPFTGGKITRQPRPPKSNSRKKECRTNTVIRSNRLPYFRNITVINFTNTCQLIHQRNTGCKHHIRRVLCHLCTAPPHRHKRLACTQKRAVQFLHYLVYTNIITADYNTVRTQEVIHCRTLFYKVRIDNNIEGMRRMGTQYRLHLFGSSRRTGRFIDDNPVSIHIFCNLPH